MITTQNKQNQITTKDTVLPTTVKIDATTKGQLKRLAAAKRRSSHWLILEAISQYIEREEKRQDFHQSAIKAWKHHQQTGLHVTKEEADQWMERLENGEENVEVPQCHV